MNIDHFGYLALRTPLLPMYHAGKGTDNAGFFDGDISVKQLLQFFSGNSSFREAILVSSPGLYDYLINTINSKNSNKEKNDLKLAKYLIRASTRCVPYGSMAAISFVRLGDTTNIRVNNAHDIKRRVQIDHEWLFGFLKTFLARNKDSINDIRLKINSLYWINDPEINFITGNSFPYKKITVKSSPILIDLVGFLKKPACMHEIIGFLEMKYLLDAGKIDGFLESLIEKEIIVPDIFPDIFSTSVLTDIAGKLNGHAQTSGFDEIKTMIECLNSPPAGAFENCLSQLIHLQKTACPDIQNTNFVHVDSYRAAPENVLARPVFDSIVECAEFLAKFKGPQLNPRIQSFIGLFKEKYGDRDVPLGEALDEESGIGYPIEEKMDTKNTFLNEIHKLQTGSSDAGYAMTRLDTFMLQKLLENPDCAQLELVDQDLLTLHHPAWNTEDLLPETFYIVFSLIAEDFSKIEQGDFRIDGFHGSGPSAINAISRFSGLHKEFDEKMEECHHYEGQMAGEDTLLAEIGYYPKDKSANILMRQHYRDHQIDLQSGSTDCQKTIDINDIIVRCKNDGIILLSASTGRKILPRLTNAHNFLTPSLNIYQFLCDLQYQDKKPGLYWSWGPFLSQQHFLPRVVYKNVILSRANWLITIKDFTDAEKFDVFSREIVKILTTKQMPHRVFWVQGGDFKLFIDFTKETCLRIFQAELLKQKSCRVEECLVTENNLFVTDGNGKYTNEFILPLKRTTSPGAHDLKNDLHALPSVKSRFVPFDEWTQLNLYCNVHFSDRLLLMIKDIFMEFFPGNKFFIVKYNVPQMHIRLRFLDQDPGKAWSIYSLIGEFIVRKKWENKIHKIELSTYDREILRYKFLPFELYEDFFFRDSVFSLQCLEILTSRHIVDKDVWRIIFSVYSCMGILNSLHCSDAAKMRFIGNIANNFRVEHNMPNSPEQRKFFNRNYATFRKMIRDNPPVIVELEQIVSERARRTSTFMEQFNQLDDSRIGETIDSLLHMSCNRLLVNKPRLNEVVIYDMVIRQFEEQQYRNKNVEQA